MSNKKEKDPMEYIGKGIATLASALVCAVLIRETGGNSGIGWFIASLVFIW